MTEIDRISRKTRRHITVSQELTGAVNILLPEGTAFAPWVEGVVWDALVAEYGEQAVLDAVEAAQAELSDDEKLPEDAHGTVTLSA